MISVIAGNSSKEIAKKLSKKLNGNLIKTEIRIFPDGESKITLKGKISKNKIIVVQSIFPPVDSNLFQALSLISKAREYSSEVVIVVPYLGYARQDREFLPGEIVSM
ncbi:MAG: ribose-phosphate pyrophosphokinase-like domain-containing protein, partial [Candidatus Nitrosomaritimum yanchengensis]